MTNNSIPKLTQSGVGVGAEIQTTPTTQSDPSTALGKAVELQGINSSEPDHQQQKMKKAEDGTGMKRSIEGEGEIEERGVDDGKRGEGRKVGEGIEESGGQEGGTTISLPSKPTRTKATEKNYEDRVETLKRRCQKEMASRFGQRSPPDFLQLAAWMVRRKDTLRPATWRQYRAALIAECEKVNDGDALTAIDVLKVPEVDPSPEATAKMLRMRKKDEKAEPQAIEPRTSAKKDKRLRWADFEKLRAALRPVAIKNQSLRHDPMRATDKVSFAPMLVTWLHVGLLTGLRPKEHMMAKMLEGADAEDYGCRALLLVENAKATNKRSFGKHRHLVLDGLGARELDMIRLHFLVMDQVIAAMRCSREVAFAFIYTKCARLMRYWVRQLWPRRAKYPTLYSTRHQFIADAKETGLTRLEIGAMVGHGSEDTAGIHYARRQSAENVVLVRPHPDDVKLVRPGRGSFERLKETASFRASSRPASETGST